MATLEYQGLRYDTHSGVYAPHDDTWLLVDAVRQLGPLEDRRVVEIGCGAGLGLIAAVRQGARGLGIDRNPAAAALARRNLALNGLQGRAACVVADLLDAVDPKRTDLILFNPPYLPTDLHERLPGDLNLAFDGGPSGNETILRFVAALAAWRDTGAPMPELVLVTSSLNDRPLVTRRLAHAGLTEVQELGTKAFPFERLYVERFRAA